MIIVKNINKSYGALKVLKDAGVHIKKSEIVSIVGASGAGKTTLLQIIGTLNRPDSGSVVINGTDTISLRDKELSAFRNQNIGFVFQFHHLLPEFTAIENVCMPAFIAKKNKVETIERAKELLHFLNVSHRMEHKPSEMSGGEQQRVAVARALINNPAIILADEPSGNLDMQNKTDLHKLFLNLRDKFNHTFVIVTHDNSLAKLSDRIITMKDGVVIR